MAEGALQLKEQGNEEYKKGNFLKAAAIYTKAIKQDPGSAILYSNRAAALLKLNKLPKAQADAEHAIQLDPDWDKGYLRAAAVAEAQGKLDQALEMYKAAQRLRPNSRDLADRVRSLSKAVAGRNGARSSSGTAAAAVAGKVASSGKGSQPSSNGSSKEQLAVAGKQQQQPRKQQQLSEDADEFRHFLIEYAKEHVEEHGQNFDPEVHFLPGSDYKPQSEEEDSAKAIRGVHAFDAPEMLSGFVGFVRNSCSGCGAVAAGLVVPKDKVAYPRVWTRSSWPFPPEEEGVLVQLQAASAPLAAAAAGDAADAAKSGEPDTLPRASKPGAQPGVESTSSTGICQRLWYIRTKDKRVKSVVEVDADFCLLPTVLRADSA